MSRKKDTLKVGAGRRARPDNVGAGPRACPDLERLTRIEELLDRASWLLFQLRSDLERNSAREKTKNAKRLSDRR